MQSVALWRRPFSALVDAYALQQTGFCQNPLKHQSRPAPNCNLRRELLHACGAQPRMLQRIDSVIRAPPIKRAAPPWTGDKFTSLYAVRSGFFRPAWRPPMVAIQSPTPDGGRIIPGWHRERPPLGANTVAGRCRVCVMPLIAVEELSRHSRRLQHHVHKIMSREIIARS